MTSQQTGNPGRRRQGKGPEPDTGYPRAVGRPATSALQAAGYTHLDQLKDVPEFELLALHGFGPKAMRIIREALAEQGAAGSNADRG